MSFNSNTARMEYVVSSATVVEYTYNFQIFEEADLIVYQVAKDTLADDTTDLIALTTDYSVVINGDTGGYITLINNPTLDDIIVIQRNLEVDRDISYNANGVIYADTLNDDQNYQSYLIADEGLQTDRALQLPTSLVGVSTTLTSPEPNAVVRWDVTGTQLINDATLGGELVLVTEKAAEAEASAAAALISETNAGISETNTAADVVLTNADVVLTNADVVLTGLDVASTNADVVLTGLDVASTGLDVISTNADVVLTNADVVLTGLDVDATNADVVLTNADVVLTNADVVLTGLDVIESATNVTNSQLKAWEAEAEALTADSYATQVEDTFVDSYSSDGDGTFTATPTTEYSALHWAAKASVGTTAGDVSVVVTNFDGNLSATDTDVQTALETIDDLVVSVSQAFSIAYI